MRSVTYIRLETDLGATNSYHLNNSTELENGKSFISENMIDDDKERKKEMYTYIQYEVLSVEKLSTRSP